MDGLELYRAMYVIRGAEELIIKHYSENEMKTPCHMSMGEEAITVGVCAALKESDQVVGSYRSHALFLAKTRDTNRFFAEMYGRVGGTAEGRAGSMHLAAPDQGHMVSSAVVASQIPMALGLAFANKRAQNGRLVVVFFGDGALDEGVFWESLNVACTMHLPVLFVCEDNGYSVQTPTSVRQGYDHIEKVVEHFCSVIPIPGSLHIDVEAIYRYVKAFQNLSSRDVARPTFMRLTYYRYLEHVGVNEDFHLGYRPRPEQWPDPLIFQRCRLLTSGVTEKEIRTCETLTNMQLQNSLEWARAQPLPSPASLHRGVFFENKFCSSP